MNQEYDHFNNQNQSLHPLLGRRLESAINEVKFESQIRIESPTFLQHHCVYDRAILPATAYIEMALTAVNSLSKSESWVVENFTIQEALILLDNEVQTIQTILTVESDQAYSFKILRLTKGQTNEELSQNIHASGKLLLKELDLGTTQTDLSVLQARCQKISVDAHYQECRERSIDYGSNFQVIEQLWRKEGEALGQIQLPSALIPDAQDYNVHPVLLDSCLQVLWAALPNSLKQQTYLPVSLERLQVYRSPGNCLWSYAQLNPTQDSSEQTLSANLYLFDESGALVIEIEGIFIGRASREAMLRNFQKKQKIALTATFTAEPVEDSLAFWSKQLNIPFTIEFAAYNQVFQELLNPNSLLGSNQDGVNVVLLRLQDWEQNDNRLQLAIDSSQKEKIFSNQLRHTLPNRLEVAHLNQYETEYLYQELFIDQVYLRHGIVLNDDACVVDVGANIGLFTLFVQQKCPNATVYSFEPAPHAFKKLESNARLYCKNANLFNCGLSSENKEETFTFYPNSSVFSGFHADNDQDEKAVRAVILNMLQQINAAQGEQLDAIADEFMAGRLDRETFQAQLRTLSSVIKEHNIERIDLLKLDAEKSELPVLQGIEDQHWEIIQQMVVEVHDQEGSVIKEVKRLLQEKGFELHIEEETLLHGSGLYNIYARRPWQTNTSSAKPVVNAAKIEQNVQDLGNALRSTASRLTTPYLICLCPASPTALADSKRSILYQQMERLLASYLDGVSGMYLLKSSELSASYPVSTYYDPHGDEFGHVPYTPAFYTALGTAIARKIHAIKSAPYKVIVLDCDQTLWKGVCGEDGVDGIEIDPPRKALQEFMVAQHDSGMLICLCSKNNQEDVWAVFEQRSEMPLKREQIVQARINWQPKSENIKSLAQELNLGLDSFIFVDDNPLECAEVQANCPAVLTLELPSEPNQIPQFLEHVWAFDHLKTTEEDKQRTALYQQNIERESFRKEALTFKDFLTGLGLEVKIAPIAGHTLARVSQLTQRTNQFNLTTIRRSESKIQQLCESGKLECLTVEVSDRFGDYGLVGVLLFEMGADAIKVDTFLLSCRALGRGVEHQMLAKLGTIAKERGLSWIDVSYIPTQKNQPALDFLDAVGISCKQQLGEGWLFKFPVNLAAELTYSPEVTESVNNSPSNPKAKHSEVNRQRQTLAIQQIATQLWDSEQILKLIESQKHRIRPPELESQFVAASNQLEEKLVKIWSEVLSIEQVGIYDNFFELGGTSLLMVQVFSKLQAIDSNISLVDLYKYPTINAQANYLRQKSDSQGQEQETFQEVDDRVRRKQHARKERKQKREVRKNG
ncbi:MAG: FkbM family methyltransferase [Symploca sp. SIO2B6]|nr:FkbM family methyltransferase [Symploca sp. SIO2B6]